VNPNVATIIQKAPFSPMKHVWFDLSDEMNLRSRMEGWLNGRKVSQVISEHVANEIPVPFDNMALILPLGLRELDIDSNPKRWVLTVDKMDDSLFFCFWIGSYTKPVLEVIFKDKLLSSPEKVEVLKQFVDAMEKKNVKATDRLMMMMQFSIPIFAALCYAPTNHLIANEAYKCKPSPSNANRIRRGKKPLFEWETVLIKSTVVDNKISLGGTHASPKPHDRRGHQRRYKNGKVVYVRSCTINKHKIKDQGFIHHDYRVVS
jgi:hypothetical protein